MAVWTFLPKDNENNLLPNFAEVLPHSFAFEQIHHYFPNALPASLIPNAPSVTTTNEV